jgi:hypothetical protein
VQARGGDAFGNVEEYVAGVERFAVLVGQGQEAGVSREAAEAALEKRNIWKNHGEVSEPRPLLLLALLPDVRRGDGRLECGERKVKTSVCLCLYVCLQYWVHVHVGCTLSQVLRHADHVIPATLPALHVYARDTKAHADFLKQNKGKIRTLNPTQA